MALSFAFIAESNGPQLLYRATLPARGLVKLGHEAWTWPACFEDKDGRLVGWNPHTGVIGKPADVVVIRFLSAPPADKLILGARRAGQVVLSDVDDDIWGLPEGHPALAAREQDNALDVLAVQMNMVASDAVVCSTRPLAEVVCRVLDTLEETDVPVAVVGSPVELPDIEASLMHEPCRVGWLGTWAYRGRDLQSIEKALADVLPGRGMLRHLGRDRGEIPLPVLLDMPPYIIHEHDWVDIAHLPPLLADLDLAVIPAEMTRFNASRSPTTGLALAACGVPFIASPIPAYVELEGNDIGLTARDDEEWRDSLLTLLGEPSIRCKLGAQGREQVGRLYSPEQAAAEWLKVVEAL